MPDGRVRASRSAAATTSASAGHTRNAPLGPRVRRQVTPCRCRPSRRQATCKDAASPSEPHRHPRGVVALTANNPSPLTLDGTNTYIAAGWVVDPGPADAAHLDAVRDGRRRGASRGSCSPTPTPTTPRARSRWPGARAWRSCSPGGGDDGRARSRDRHAGPLARQRLPGARAGLLHRRHRAGRGQRLHRARARARSAPTSTRCGRCASWTSTCSARATGRTCTIRARSSTSTSPTAWSASGCCSRRWTRARAPRTSCSTAPGPTCRRICAARRAHAARAHGEAGGRGAGTLW